MKINKAAFVKEGSYYEQTYNELRDEAENKAQSQHFTGTEDEIDESEEEYALEYLRDCFDVTLNTPVNSAGELVDFHQWLDWLQYGYFTE